MINRAWEGYRDLLFGSTKATGEQIEAAREIFYAGAISVVMEIGKIQDQKQRMLAILEFVQEARSINEKTIRTEKTNLPGPGSSSQANHDS